MYSTNQLKNMAAEIAEKHGVPIPLITQLIESESAWSVYAARFEPNFERFFAPGPDVMKTTWQTERELQKISWGLCQIMGWTARTEGWLQPIPAILDPRENINFACRYLVKLRNHYPQQPSWRWAVTAYNHGERWEQINPNWWHEGYTAKFHDILSQLGEA
jgi:hypothetical protein